MTESKPVRIDKYLWAVRIFKTRSLASNACRTGRVMINGNPVKSSKSIEVNEIITVKTPPVTYSYRVTCPLGNRVSAKLAMNYIEDITPENEKIKLRIRGLDSRGFRKKGSGRPTKKERRIIDSWNDGFNDI